MALKTPLATIYEESGSFIAAFGNHQQGDQESRSDFGLISSRSIPTVDRQRQRIYPYRRKPPIEVRFRDGSKRFIHPSTTAKMLLNRRNLLDSSQGKTVHFERRPIFHSKFQSSTIRSKPLPLVITIITADDLRQAGITPTSSSSASSSDLSSIALSQTDSPLYRLKPLEKLPEESSIRPLNTSMMNVQSHSFSHLPSNSSLQMTLPTDENEYDRSFNSKQTNTSTVIEYTNRSAFHPIIKPIQFHEQAPAMKPRIPLKVSRSLFNRTQQQKQIVPYSQSNDKPVSFIPKESSSNLKSVIPITHQNHSKSINHLPGNVVHFSDTINHNSRPHPTITWLNITSQSIHDIPHLSSKYWRTPLRITVPFIAATHNQQLLMRRETALETRLLNAGVSPETVALYGRILNLADNRPMKLTPPKMLDSY